MSTGPNDNRDSTRQDHIDALARRLRDLIPADVWREALDGNDELTAFRAIAHVLLEADAVPHTANSELIAACKAALLVFDRPKDYVDIREDVAAEACRAALAKAGDST